jgi:hypothetical protein
VVHKNSVQGFSAQCNIVTSDRPVDPTSVFSCLNVADFNSAELPSVHRQMMQTRLLCTAETADGAAVLLAWPDLLLPGK